jgi:hypothetical protein
VLVPQTLKRVHYSYDIKEFVDSAIVMYIKKGYIDMNDIYKLHEWLSFLMVVAS